MAELTRFSTATEIAAKVRAGEWTARRVADFFIDLVVREDFDPAKGQPVAGGLQCFVGLDIDAIRSRADVVDAAVTAGADPGPLAGVPVGIKDNISVAGASCTCCSKLLAGYVAPYDAHVITQLDQAGAVPFGRLNMDEFAKGSSCENSAYWPTRNPYNTGCVPGGSSGGSAAAVAAGLVPVALGSDTGGSIRQPAALTGTVGLKPTWGRVSRYGLVAFGSSLDQIGPFARTVEDAALCYTALAGADPRDSTSLRVAVEDPQPGLAGGVKGLRIGLPREVSADVDGVEPSIAAAVETAANRLREAGAEIVDVSVPLFTRGLPAYYILANSETSANLARFDGVRYGARLTGEAADLSDRPVPPEPEGGFSEIDRMYLATRGRNLGLEVRRRIMLGTYALSSGYYDAYYKRAQKLRTLIRAAFDRVFTSGADGRPVDALLLPTSPTLAFRLGEKTADPLAMYLCDVFAAPASLAGIPAISVPGGLSDDGLPIGLQLLAAEQAEAKLLQVAAAVEQAMGLLPHPQPV